MALETELDDDGDIEDIPDEDSEDSECEGADDDHGITPVQSRVRQPPPVAVKKPVASEEPSSYLVERMNQMNGTIFYQTRGGAAAAAAAAVAAAKSKRTSEYFTQILFLSTINKSANVSRCHDILVDTSLTALFGMERLGFFRFWLKHLCQTQKKVLFSEKYEPPLLTRARDLAKSARGNMSYF